MMPYNPNPQPDQTYAPQQQQQQSTPAPQANGRATDTGPPKAFACSTCGKGFARRSDLARHGTICENPPDSRDLYPKSQLLTHPCRTHS
jgi:uncharacterized Zn-finger protein